MIVLADFAKTMFGKTHLLHHQSYIEEEFVSFNSFVDCISKNF